MQNPILQENFDFGCSDPVLKFDAFPESDLTKNKAKQKKVNLEYCWLIFWYCMIYYHL